ncbi:FAD-dependent thymidylate synthase, partial [Bacillus sp. PPSBB_11]|uniref:FAD-dependent thymidylate synthase n=1 Tax=Bacillus sp. PPSBB_11 TaxID=3125777 RepID=UPI0030F6B238
AYTQLSDYFHKDSDSSYEGSENATDCQVIALSAIRNCYSSNKPSEIVAKEGAKYFGNSASDGGSGTDADRLFRQIVASKHTSTLEHLTFTFAIEGVSRALLAQLTRHRAGFSFSVQSQRYVKMGSGNKSGGFDYVVPEKVSRSTRETPFYNVAESRVTGHTAEELFETAMTTAQECYDALRDAGVPAEDCRAVLPQAAATNLVMTVNLRALLDFYAKRRKGNGAQAEIADLAEALRREVIEVEPWTAQFFEGVSASE